ncbi:DoxX family protein [Actinacidiphila paucisporea]|uniref:DoxX-like family protein n=1 Tax=Actinacidiphila paucisporea TaxID=310782 RepID=A0A1M7NJ93_9ACTN|nr:DoxX family protein [Actinacidiphila paucisporea]SHN03995.1 DoxX-like family protein [Actinacidiphila paucisporea]
MFISYVVVGVLLAVVLIASGRAKLIHDEKVVGGVVGLGVPEAWIPRLALLEVAAGLGLAAGVAYRPLGVAAAAGVVAYFTGALATHLRAGDVKGTPVPGALLAGGALALVLALASL